MLIVDALVLFREKGETFQVYKCQEKPKKRSRFERSFKT